MTELSPLSNTKLGVLKHRARLKAVDMLHAAYEEAAARYGLTKADFARRIGMKPSHLSRILSGSQNVTVETVEAVLRAFESRLVTGYEPLDNLVEKPSNRYPRPESKIEFVDASKPTSTNLSSKYKTEISKW